MIPLNLASALSSRRKYVEESAVVSEGQGQSSYSPNKYDATSKGESFLPKSDCGHTGLVNQGATCYLNSLLQCLYMLPDFRSSIFQWNYDFKLHGSEEMCLTRQLQILFAELSLSNKAAIATSNLTKSFGWSGVDSFIQQDIQECMTVIFDFICVQCQGSNLATLIHNNMHGRVKNALTCQNCCKTRGMSEAFRDIQLQVRGFNNLEKSIQAYVEEEFIEGINCEDCGGKYLHSKGLQLTKLPNILSLQLKRFDIDYNTFTRYKYKLM